MANEISIKIFLEKNNLQNTEYVTFPFYFGGEKLESFSEKHARWGMTLLKAGAMRFRWNENNENRNAVLKSILTDLKNPICTGNCSSSKGECDCKLKISPIEMIHSRDIFEAKREGDTKNLTGDGVYTKNPLLVPTVTVADCVPIFLYDKKKKAFGAFHSGWKGTGIICEGIKKFISEYDSKIQDLCVAIGAHIGDCCYFVDEKRAEYFIKNFGEKCVKKLTDVENHKEFPFRLSLTEANLFALKKYGIFDENIVVAEDCTCCSKFKNGENIFGSFRRQAAFLPPEIDSDTRSRAMTVQAAFVYLP